jgi:hypothetical protein
MVSTEAWLNACLFTDYVQNQPPIQWVTELLYSGLEWPGSEADHSSPSTVEVKNAYSYKRLHGVVFN